MGGSVGGGGGREWEREGGREGGREEWREVKMTYGRSYSLLRLLTIACDVSRKVRRREAFQSQ